MRFFDEIKRKNGNHFQASAVFCSRLFYALNPLKYNVCWAITFLRLNMKIVDFFFIWRNKKKLFNPFI